MTNNLKIVLLHASITNIWEKSIFKMGGGGAGIGKNAPYIADLKVCQPEIKFICLFINFNLPDIIEALWLFSKGFKFNIRLWSSALELV